MAQAPILVVEDEFLVARGIHRKLARLGYGVLAVAGTGEEAVQRAGCVEKPINPETFMTAVEQHVPDRPSGERDVL